ncbi:MAG: capsule biosynthesis protein [Bacillaceae bacterium]|nr:capsule biosynthesis protein [Bacillaceae bacterium]
MEETISLKELFETLKKRLALILAITFLSTAIAGIISYFFITPVYQVSTQLLVNRSQTDENYNIGVVQANLQLVNTYNVIITSPRILDKVIDELDLDLSVNELKEKINVQSEKDSQVVNVSVEDEDPKRAVTIANKIAEVFQREVISLMKVDNVSILAKAELPKELTPVKPKPLLNMAIAFIVGLMLGVGLAFLLEYLDNTIKTEEDIQKYLELPVLGVISTFDSSSANGQTIKSRSHSRKRG